MEAAPRRRIRAPQSSLRRGAGVDLAVLVSWIAAGVFAVLLLVVLRREVPRRLAPGLVAAISASLVFAVGDALWRQTPLESPAHWPMLLLMWAGVGSVPPAWWALALSFAHQHGEFRAGRALRFTPAYLQAFFFGLLLTNPFHGQFLTPAAHRSDFHWIAWLHASVTYATLLATLGVYGWLALRARRRAVRAQSAFMALGSLVPAAANVVYVASPRPPAIDPTMVAAVVSSLLLVYLITRRQLFELSPVDFSEVRRQDSDAVLLLDPRGRLLDANPASRALFGRVLEDPDAARRIGRRLASGKYALLPADALGLREELGEHAFEAGYGNIATRRYADAIARIDAALDTLPIFSG